ncbi:MAG: nitroreductase family protein [Deinococcus sp.]|nr:nitroreductase family protein [Deinococcus sp.]MCL5965216.1 nitroreductase family protein [Deinococcus sp.]
MTDLLEVFKTRASVRKFKHEPLREGDLEKILFAARRAPTDATAQMYSLLRVTDTSLRQKIAQLAGGQEHIEAAAEFFLILADVHRLRRLVEHKGAVWGHWPRTAAHFAITDAVLAGSALATMAEWLGYGICWIGGVLNNIREIGDLCKLPKGVFPVAGLCVGVPEERPKPRPRLARELVVHENHYREPSSDELAAALVDMAPITRSGNWHALLARYFAEGGTMEQREGPYQAFAARQGFDPDIEPDAAGDAAAGSLGSLIQKTLEGGFRGVQFGPGHVWIEKETAAYRGEGPPGKALQSALLSWKAENKA